MRLSIIVPVYNVEPTLEACVGSILRQEGCADFELVLVDDGSPDSCPQMCDAWASRDSRVRVIHKLNGGLSSARNAGIDASRGELLMFVDSDDTLGEDSIAPLVDIMDANSDVDILEFPVVRVEASVVKPWLSFSRPLTLYSDKKEYWLEGEAYRHTYSCNKVYRRRLFSPEDDRVGGGILRFPVGRVFEDAFMLPRLLQRARLVATTSSGAYHYYVNPQGISATAGARELRQLLDAHIDVLPRLIAVERQRLSGALRDYYLHVADIQIALCETTRERPVLATLRVTMSGLSLVHWLKAAVINTLGLPALCRANSLLRRLFPRKSR